MFKISTNGAMTTLYAFGTVIGTNAYAPNGYALDGTGPNCLVKGGDGNYYGTTIAGGAANGVDPFPFEYGTVFRMTPAGVLTTLVSFDGAHASGPNGLVQGSDGNFFGTTSGLGQGDYGETVVNGGTLFKMNPVGVLATLYSFTYGTNIGYGSSAGPNGLVHGGDGNFYGTTAPWVGAGIDGIPARAGNGAVFKMTPAGVLTTLVSFNGVNGSGPNGLVQGTDGNFYGTTSTGGQGGAGTVFRLTIMPEFQSVTLTNGTLNLTWSTEVGGMYQLQFNSDLTSTNWTNLGSPLPATASTLTATDYLPNGPRRFYRLVLSP